MPLLKESEIFAGRKRKRVASGTENVQLLGAKTARGGRRFKKVKAVPEIEEETESDSMEVDNDSEADEHSTSRPSHS